MVEEKVVQPESQADSSDEKPQPLISNWGNSLYIVLKREEWDSNMYLSDVNYGKQGAGFLTHILKISLTLATTYEAQL